MMIEGAERYGVSQLHQLRGRVGRGEHDSQCLLFPEGAGAMARRRLEAVAAESDGFKLAEVDLVLRGEGEMLGTRQHGLPRFAVAELPDDTPTLIAARERGARPAAPARLARGSRPRAAARRRPAPLRRRRRRPDTNLRMRVIAGELKGQRLVAPRGHKVRPTSDRVREAIFSALGARVEGARVLDLFCGTGALAIEALSRGAAAAVLVDRDTRAALGNVERLGLGERVELVRSDAGALAGGASRGARRVALRPDLRRRPL